MIYIVYTSLSLSIYTEYCVWAIQIWPANPLFKCFRIETCGNFGLGLNKSRLICWVFRVNNLNKQIESTKYAHMDLGIFNAHLPVVSYSFLLLLLYFDTFTQTALENCFDSKISNWTEFNVERKKWFECDEFAAPQHFWYPFTNPAFDLCVLCNNHLTENLCNPCENNSSSFAVGPEFYTHISRLSTDILLSLPLLSIASNQCHSWKFNTIVDWRSWNNVAAKMPLHHRESDFMCLCYVRVRARERTWLCGSFV